MKVVDVLGDNERKRYELQSDRWGTFFHVEAYDEKGHVVERHYLDADLRTCFDLNIRQDMVNLVREYKRLNLKGLKT